MLFKFKVVVKDDERAFLVRDGRFERLLDPGRFVALDYGRRLTAEVVKVARKYFRAAELGAGRRGGRPPLALGRRCCSRRRLVVESASARAVDIQMRIRARLPTASLRAGAGALTVALKRGACATACSTTP